MSTDKRQGEWANVKVGDEIWWYDEGARSRLVSATVERITPSGQVVDSKGNSWSAKAARGDGWYKVWAYPMTDDVKVQILEESRGATAFSLVSNIHTRILKASSVSEATIDALKAVVSTLDGEGA